MWIAAMQADVDSLTYDFEASVGGLQTKEHSPPDMSGCCRYFEERFPGIGSIEVLIGPNGSTGTTIYRRTPAGWEAAHR